MLTDNATADYISADIADAILPVTMLYGVLAVIGLMGNSLVMFFFKFKYPPCNFRTFVLFLALIDIIGCVVTLPLEVFVHRHWFNYPSSMEWLCITKKLANGIILELSAALLFLISVDRYLKVCKPLSTQINPKRALQFCVFIMIVVPAILMPFADMFGIQTSNITYKGADVVVFTCQRSDRTKHQKWHNIYIWFSYYGPTILCMVITTILYGFILKVLLVMFCGSRRKSGGLKKSVKFGKNASTNETLVTLTENSSTDFVNQNSEASKEKRNEEQEKSGKTENLLLSVQTDKNSPSDGNVVPIKELSSTDIVNQTSIQSQNKHETRRKSGEEDVGTKVVRKTVIMLFVTVVFDVTIVIYIVTYNLVIHDNLIYTRASSDTIGVVFLLYRLYFINHIINPFVYGFYDRRFKSFIKDFIKRPCKQ